MTYNILYELCLKKSSRYALIAGFLALIQFLSVSSRIHGITQLHRNDDSKADLFEIHNHVDAPRTRALRIAQHSGEVRHSLKSIFFLNFLLPNQNKRLAIRMSML